MAWINVHENDYGWVGKLTIVQDGTAQDISSYTTLQFILEDPSGNDAPKTASFDSDGTDGILKYTTQNGDIDESGTWGVSARIAKSGVELTSAIHRFTVLPRQDA